MNKERLLILKMVEEGKITSQEAVELLEAIDNSQQADEDKPDDGWRKLEKQGEEFAHKIEQAADRFSRSLETKLDSGLAEQLATIPRLFAKIPFVNIGEEVHKFVQEYSGTFAVDLNEIPIILATTNGDIAVEGWDQDHYKLVVTQRIRAKERELAIDKVIELQLPEKRDDCDDLIVELMDQKDVTISFNLYLPRKNPYLLKLNTTNGKCNVANLLSKEAKIYTTNGSINVRQSRSDHIEAVTSNGSNIFDYVEADNIRQTTVNGSIKLMGTAREIACTSTNGSVKVTPLTFVVQDSKMQLQTTNGSINCRVPRLPELNFKVDASSSIGKVNIGLDNFVPTVDERSGGRRVVQGEVISKIESPKTIAISARVSSGSISLEQEQEKQAN